MTLGRPARRRYCPGAIPYSRLNAWRRRTPRCGRSAAQPCAGSRRRPALPPSPMGARPAGWTAAPATGCAGCTARGCRAARARPRRIRAADHAVRRRAGRWRRAARVRTGSGREVDRVGQAGEQAMGAGPVQLVCAVQELGDRGRRVRGRFVGGGRPAAVRAGEDVGERGPASSSSACPRPWAKNTTSPPPGRRGAASPGGISRALEHRPTRRSLPHHRCPEALTVEEVPLPAPGPGEVLVRAESLFRTGTYFYQPTPPTSRNGYEAAGTVEAVGSGVEEFAPATPWRPPPRRS